MKLNFENFFITFFNFILLYFLYLSIRNINFNLIILIFFFIFFIFLYFIKTPKKIKTTLLLILIFRFIIRIGFIYHTTITLENYEIITYLIMSFIIIYYLMNKFFNYYSFEHIIKKSINYILVIIFLIFISDKILCMYSNFKVTPSLIFIVTFYFFITVLSLKLIIDFILLINKTHNIIINYFYNIVLYYLVNPFIFFFIYSYNKTGSLFKMDSIGTINFLDLSTMVMFFVFLLLNKKGEIK